MTGIVPLPPFPLDWRNHDEQRTSPTNIPADAECGFRQSFGSDPLTGTWDYDSNTTYQFDGKESGAMILTSATYDFSYQVKGNQLFIDFSNEAARDCTYTFSVNDNTLTLTGGEGTIGGTYELHRQEE